MKGFFESLFGRTKTSEKRDKFYFIKAENILNVEENKSGLITNLELDPKYKFYKIKLREKPSIITKTQGMTKVIQDLKIVYDNPGAIFADLKAIKDKGKGLSILHIDPFEKSFLYGQHKGLEIIELTEEKIILEGEELDIFFEVDINLAHRICVKVKGNV